MDLLGASLKHMHARHGIALCVMHNNLDVSEICLHTSHQVRQTSRSVFTVAFTAAARSAAVSSGAAAGAAAVCGGCGGAVAASCLQCRSSGEGIRSPVWLPSQGAV